MQQTKPNNSHQRVVIYIDVKRNEIKIANQTGKLEHYKNYEGRWELAKIIEKFILVGANLDSITTSDIREIIKGME